MCVRKSSARRVLQFTPFNAASCVLHRPASRVIHRLQLFCFWFLLIAQRGVQVRDLKRRLRGVCATAAKDPERPSKLSPPSWENPCVVIQLESLHKSELRLGTADRFSGGAKERADSTCLRRDKSTTVLDRRCGQSSSEGMPNWRRPRLRHRNQSHRGFLTCDQSLDAFRPTSVTLAGSALTES